MKKIYNTEIRLDNLVMHDHEGILKVHSIGRRTIGLTNSEDLYFAFIGDDLEPIPLTPEIFEKCGFVKSKIPYVVPNYEITIGEGINRDDILCISLGGNATLVGYTPDEAVTVQPDILYLHQLQNLVFALMGKELQINL